MPAMGRRRTKNLDLPMHMERKGDAFYYVIDKKWEPLGSDKAEALRKWALKEGGAEGKTVKSLVLRYIDLFGAPWAENTRRNYERYGDTITEYFGDAPIEQVTPGHIQEFIDLSQKKSEVRNTVMFFSAMLSRAVLWGWRETNPCDSIEKPPPSKRKRYLTDAERLVIYETVAEPYKIAMDLADILSLAVSEVVGIKLPDIKDGRIRVFRKKTGKETWFFVTPELEAVIARAMALPRPVRDMAPLLCSRRGKAYAPGTVSKAIKTAIKARGIVDARFHDLRAKSASDEPETAQARLMHADAKTTRTYLRKPSVVMPLRRKY